MDGKKMIKINPDFFSVSRKKTRKKEKRSTKNLRQSIKPNDIKRKLIEKIKEHQLRKQESNVEEKEEKEFKEDFNTQLNYLEKVINKKKKKKYRRRTRHKMQRSLPHHNKEPPYGCLKNGKKPTFSQYNRTLKKNPLVIEGPIHTFPKPPMIKERQEKLRKLKEKIATPPRPKSKMIQMKKTIKIFKLGKNKKTANVGVLIKCSKTRKMVQNEQKVLRMKCLAEIKQYLRKHNLIKIGSSAPEDILRKIYEDSFLAGNIFNKNPDNLLHNYLNNDEDNFFK